MQQKESFPQFLPWRNKEEWLNVYKKLYASNPADLDWAVRQVAVWQARCPSTGLLGVETTVGLIKARILDHSKSGHENEAEISMVYSLALVRFVNLICETGQSRSHVTPIRNIANKMGIPEWLVNIRHSATHRHSLPSVDMLRTGTSLALQWLKLNYWEKEMPHLDDYRPLQGLEDRKNTISRIKNSLQDFQKTQFSVLYQKANSSILQDKLNIMRSCLNKHPNLFVQILSETEFLVSKYHHLEALLKPGEIDFLHGNSVQLPHSLEKFWAPVLNLFLHNDPVQCLVKFLLQPHIPEDVLADRVAVAWVNHILNIVNSQEYHIFSFKPTLNWLELYEVALKHPTKYSLSALELISENVPLSDDIKQTLSALAAIYLGSVSTAIIPKKLETLYTSADVQEYFSSGSLKRVQEKESWKMYKSKVKLRELPLGCIIQERNDISENFPAIEDPDGEMLKVEASKEPVLALEASEMQEDEVEPKKIPSTVDLSSSLLFM